MSDPVPADQNGAAVRSIAVLSMAAFASSATIRVADPLLPQLSHEFGVTAGVVSVVSTAATLAYGLCQLLYGPLGDRFGKYRLIAFATLMSALATSASVLAENLDTLALLRLLSGGTAAAIIPLSMAYIGDTVPYEKRQPILARFGSGQISGLIFGQAAGGAFADFVGWRGVFLTLGAIYFCVAILLFIELKSSRVVDRHGDRINLAALPGRFWSIISRPKARSVLPTVFTEGLLFFGAFTFVSAYAHNDFGLSFLAIGGILACFGVGGLIYASTVGWIVRGLGQRRMAFAGGILMGLSFALYLAIPVWWLLPPAVVIAGLGFYMMHNTLQTNATQMAPEARGLAVSIFASVLFIGQAIGVAIAGIVVDRAGFQPVFAVAALTLPVLAYLFSTSLPRKGEGA